jgi:two-component system sensor histidine kinase UhpB
MPLFWRVFLINALVMGTGALLLVLTPATISSPVSESQLAVLAAGLVLLLALNFLLIRPYIRPLEKLTGAMSEVDLLAPGTRVTDAAKTPELRAVSDAFNGMLARLEDERRQSAQRALAAQEGERLRVSRELHDEVGQRLTGVLLRLRNVEQRAPAGLRPDLEQLRDEVRVSLEEVRDTARRLRPEALEDLGLASALAALTHDATRGTPVSITRTFSGEVNDLGDELEVVIYRVAQEALTNVVRHSGARHAVLAVTREGNELLLSVTDDGCGFEPARTPRGAGLTGMSERALLIGGRLRIKSRPGSGTTVQLAAPVAGSR